MGRSKEYWKSVAVALAAILLSGTLDAVLGRVTREEVLVVDQASVVMEIMPQDSIVAKFVGDNHVATCNTSDGSRPHWYIGRGDSIRGTSAGSPVPGELWRGPGNGLQIVISKIEKKDRGEYCCRTKGGGGGGSRRPTEKCFELTVKEPIVFLDTPTEQVATEGMEYVIKCEVTGDPLPEVQWKVRGQASWQGPRLKEIGDGLSIRNVSIQDQGHYECAAVQMSEQVTSQQTRNISLRVRHGPKWLRGVSSPPTVYGYLSGEVNLTCAVTADPPASIVWFPEKDRQQLSEPMASRVISTENKSILRVKLSNGTVFGKYRCRAKNELGVVQREILLQQGLQPKPPQRVTLTSVSATSAVLDIVTPPVGPTVQQSTQGSQGKQGSQGTHGSHKGSSKGGGVNDLLGYRVRLNNGTDSFEQDCDPVPCHLVHLSPGTNFTMRIATRGLAGLSDWVDGPALRTAVSAATLPGGCPALVLAVVALLLTALAS